MNSVNTDKKVSVIFSDLLITASHHVAAVLRNISLSSSDKPQHSSSTETIIKDDRHTRLYSEGKPGSYIHMGSSGREEQLLSAPVLHTQSRKLHVHRHKHSGKRQQSVHRRRSVLSKH